MSKDAVDLRDVVICPACRQPVAGGTAPCPSCGAALQWIEGFPGFRAALGELARCLPASDGVPPPIEDYLPDAIPLNVGTETVMGRGISGPAHHVQLPHRGVRTAHCVIVRQPHTDRYWIAACSSSCPVYVNKRPTDVCRLFSGDLVQIGPFAWIFSGAHGYLEPVRAINGLRLQLHDVGLEDRVCDISFQVPAGQMLAVVGPSGSGKSTLMRVLIGAPAARDRGIVLADGRNIDQEADWFRSHLGYVSQKEVLLPDLHTREVVEFAARLRGKPGGADVDHILRQVDIQDQEPNRRRGTWRTPVGKLSGGQSKRVQTAAALVAEPRLLILDEPGSGLDHDREIALLTLLRSLSYRGCTIVVVTHNRHVLEWFDRVLAVKQGKIDFDGTPTELRATIPSGEFRDLAPGVAREADDDSPTALPASAGEEMPAASSSGPLRQWMLLLQRELTLLRNSPGKRLLVPLTAVPALFAVSLGVSVRPTDHHLLGFLAVLACVWMGASLSLMTIVNEREVFDHERLLFLKVIPYVASKTGVLLFLSAVQVVVFLVILKWLRQAHIRSDSMLYGDFWCALVLMLVAWAGGGLGLLISASVGTSRPLANFLLPLLMMLQIVFSVEVAGSGAAPMEEAYGEFTLHRCQADQDCLRRAQYWKPDIGWTCNRCLGRNAAGERSLSLDPTQIELENAKRPTRLATLASYLTISRYGDIALRTFAYSQNDYDAPRSGTEPEKSSNKTFGYSRWFWEALAWLAVLVFALPTAAALVLRFLRIA